LVSDDGKHINTHKIILSASSVYFKEMLKKANHAQPMIIFHGFVYKDLKLIMDYIYQGEVQLYENEINYFLSVAQKLKIEGLQTNSSDYPSKTTMKDCLNKEESQSEIFTNKNEIAINTINDEVSQNETLNETSVQVIEELMVKVENGWSCKHCGKIFTLKGVLKRHVEIHTEGLVIICDICNESFKTRNLLKNHKYRTHRTNIVSPIATLNEEALQVIDELMLQDANGWSCKHCGKGFEKKNDLKRHVEIHTDGLAFICNICYDSFKNRNLLRNHKYRTHKKDPKL